MSTTLGELKAQIADWLDREDLFGQIPDFIKQAETVIYRGLRTRENEFRQQYPNPQTGETDLSNPVPLPQNFREMKIVIVDGRQAERISDQEFFRRRQNGIDNWEITDNYYFTIIEREFYLFPWPLEEPAEGWGEHQIDVVYYGTESIVEMAPWDTSTFPNTVPEGSGGGVLTSIRGDEATSRLLQVAPDVYLYQSLAQALKYLKQYQEAAGYEQMASAALAALTEENAIAEYAGSTVSVSSIYHD